MIHRYHTPDEESQILRDHCHECARQAEDPRLLDQERLHVLTLTALRWEYGSERVPGDRYPQTDNERRACQILLDAINLTAGIFGVRRYPEWAMDQMGLREMELG
jgi:hypothetical protein